MDANIEKWRVQQYTQNVYHLSQQKGSRFAPLVRKETFKGKTEYFDTLGLSTAQLKGGRNSATPDLNIAHERRAVTTNMYEWATLVDRKDKLVQIHNPENEYAVSARNALGRSMDDVIIAGAFGIAVTGEAGGGTQALPNAQKIAAVGAGPAIAKLNLLALRTTKYLFDKNEVEGKRYFAVDADSLMSLLGDSTITSADFNSVKALVNGELNTFMGFEFLRTERLPLATTHDDLTFKYNTTTGLYDAGGTAIAGTDKTCMAFVGDGIILGMNEGMVGKIDERNDKSYSMQVYASMDFGSVRMEDVKVVQVVVKA